MITVIDYGLGNTQAFVNIFHRLAIPVRLARSVDDLIDSTHIILPGVGAFDWAMDRLISSGMRTELDRLVLEDRKPVLGICVGMQMMAKSSEEGQCNGLAWFDAKVKRFKQTQIMSCASLPHMGWNDVKPHNTENLFKNIGEDGRFYFLHSYYFSPTNQSDELAQTQYGISFASAVRADNIYGVQFHPEKSHGWGVQLLKNFSEL